MELNATSPATYLRDALPSPDDDTIRSFVHERLTSGELPACDDGQTTAITCWFLLAFADRKAALAVREGSEQHLKEGLAAVGLASAALPITETLQVVSLLFDASVRINADATELFSEYAAVAKPPLREEMRNFPQRSPEDRSIGAMGCSERWRLHLPTPVVIAHDSRNRWQG